MKSSTKKVATQLQKNNSALPPFNLMANTVHDGNCGPQAVKQLLLNSIGNFPSKVGGQIDASTGLDIIRADICSVSQEYMNLGMALTAKDQAVNQDDQNTIDVFDFRPILTMYETIFNNQIDFFKQELEKSINKRFDNPDLDGTTKIRYQQLKPAILNLQNWQELSGLDKQCQNDIINILQNLEFNVNDVIKSHAIAKSGELNQKNIIAYVTGVPSGHSWFTNSELDAYLHHHGFTRDKLIDNVANTAATTETLISYKCYGNDKKIWLYNSANIHWAAADVYEDKVGAIQVNRRDKLPDPKIEQLKQALEARLADKDKHLAYDIEDSFVKPILGPIVGKNPEIRNSFLEYLRSETGIEKLHAILTQDISGKWIEKIIKGSKYAMNANFEQLFNVLFTKNEEKNEYIKSDEFQALLSVFSLQELSTIFGGAKENATKEILSLAKTIFVTEDNGRLSNFDGQWVQVDWFKPLLTYMTVEQLSKEVRYLDQHAKSTKDKGKSAKALEELSEKMLIKVEDSFKSTKQKKLQDSQIEEVKQALKIKSANKNIVDKDRHWQYKAENSFVKVTAAKQPETRVEKKDEAQVAIAGYASITHVEYLKQKLKSKLAIEDHDLLNNLDESFISSITGKTIKAKGAFFDYLRSEEGIEKLYVILTQGVFGTFISHILSDCRFEATSSFKNLFDVLFTKNENSETYTKSNEFQALLSVFKLKNIQAIFSCARENAAEEIVNFAHTIFLKDKDGKLSKHAGQWKQVDWFAPLLKYTNNGAAIMVALNHVHSKKQLPDKHKAQAALEALRDKWVVKVKGSFKPTGQKKSQNLEIEKLTQALWAKLADKEKHLAYDVEESFINAIAGTNPKTRSLFFKYFQSKSGIEKLHGILTQGVQGKWIARIISGSNDEINANFEKLFNVLFTKNADSNEYTKSEEFQALISVFGAKKLSDIFYGAKENIAKEVLSLVKTIFMTDGDGRLIQHDGQWVQVEWFKILLECIGIKPLSRVIRYYDGSQYSDLNGKSGTALEDLRNNMLIKIGENYETSCLVQNLIEVLGVDGFKFIIREMGKWFYFKLNKVANKVFIKDQCGEYIIDEEGNYQVSPLICQLMKALGKDGFTSIMAKTGGEFSVALDEVAKEVFMPNWNCSIYDIDAEGNYVISPLITKLQKTLGKELFTVIMTGAGKALSSMVDQIYFITEPNEKKKFSHLCQKKFDAKIISKFASFSKYKIEASSTSEIKEFFNLLYVNDFTKLSIANLTLADLITSIKPDSGNILSMPRMCDKLQNLLYVINNPDLQPVMQGYYMHHHTHHCQAERKLGYHLSEAAIIQPSANPALNLLISLQRFIILTDLPLDEQDEISRLTLEEICSRGKAMQLKYISASHEGTLPQEDALFMIHDMIGNVMDSADEELDVTGEAQYLEKAL